MLLACSLAVTVAAIAATPPRTSTGIVAAQVAGAVLALAATGGLLWPARNGTRRARSVVALGTVLVAGLLALLLPASVAALLEVVQLGGFVLLAPGTAVWIGAVVIAVRQPGRGAAGLTALGLLLLLTGLGFAVVALFAELMLRPASHRVTVGLHLVNPVLLGGYLVLLGLARPRAAVAAPVPAAPPPGALPAGDPVPPSGPVAPR